MNKTSISPKDLFRRLAQTELLDAPAGETGVVAQGEAEATRTCVPILSVYLDARPLLSGDQPAMRAGRLIVHERLHQIAQTFWPRGAAYDNVIEGARRVEAYLDTEIAPAAQGVAIFASPAHHLFETLVTDVAFETQVSALATPDLFQLAGLLDDHEVAVVAVAHTNAMRLFVTHRGGMREALALVKDPKFFHQVHQTNAMNQAHYQRHARQVRADFAREIAHEIERLFERTGAQDVILGGDAVAVPILREALQEVAPQVAAHIRGSRIPLDPDMPRDALWEEIEPLLWQTQRLYERSLVERLIEAVQADALGVAGYTATRKALEAGQADALLLAEETSIAAEARSELLALAARTDAEVAIIERDAALEALGGVGALLRYRTRQT